MDMSKLPRLSESPAPPPTPAEPVPAAREKALLQPMGIEYALITLGIGVILMLFVSGPMNILTYLSNPASLPIVTDTDGTTITYRQSAIFWADLGIFALSVLLIVEGLVNGLTRWAWARLLMILLAVGCALLNLYVCVALRDKIGMQMFNALAALVGLLFVVINLRQFLGARTAPLPAA